MALDPDDDGPDENADMAVREHVDDDGEAVTVFPGEFIEALAADQLVPDDDGPPPDDDGDGWPWGPWDDGLADVLALCRASLDDDEEAVRVILRHCSRSDVLGTSLRLLSQAIAEAGPCPMHLWQWARSALERGR